LDQDATTVWFRRRERTGQDRETMRVLEGTQSVVMFDRNTVSMDLPDRLEMSQEAALLREREVSPHLLNMWPHRLKHRLRGVKAF
jgi:hypothetical protein